MLPGIFGERLFDEFFNNSLPSYRRQEHKSAGRIMNTDVRELDHTYELDVDLPGFKKEDVTVELSKGYLTITASHEETEEEQEKKGQYLRRERWSGACSRTFYIGEGLEPADVHARFDNGILNLSFPKTPAEKKPDQKYVNII